MFKKHYEIIENPPQPISWDEYAKTSYSDYLNLLQNQGDDESVFQRFLNVILHFSQGLLNYSVHQDTTHLPIH